MKLVIDVRPVKFNNDFVCEHCNEHKTTYWLEELAMGICTSCFKELYQECGDGKDTK